MSRKYTKQMFTIKATRSGSQIRGRENEVVYHVYYKGIQMDGKHDKFMTKKEADAWLSAVIKEANKRAQEDVENGVR